MMSIQHKKIALFGFFGWGNLGNTGTLQAFLHHLRRHLPEAEVHCICANPEDVAEHFQIPVFPIDLMPHRFWYKPTNPILRVLHQGLLRVPLEAWLWFKAYRYVQGFDLLLIPGTGVLDDFGVGPFQTPYDLFKWCMVTKLSGTQLSFVSVGAGPILHPVSRWFCKAALALADYRSYRDELSKRYMASIGFTRGDNGVYPDLMFSLPLPSDINKLWSDASSNKMQQQEAVRVIGVGVIEYYGWHNTHENGEELYQQYLAKLGRFVLWLLEKEHVVRILIGQIHDQRAVDDLKVYIERTNTALLPLLIAEPIASTADLFQQIVTTDMVVATRFHNVLCSLMLDKPVVSIGYAKKNDVLMAEMGLGEYCQQIEEFDVERLQAQFTRLAENSDQIREQIRAKNIEYRQALDEQYRQIAQSVQTPGPEGRTDRLDAGSAAVL